MESNEIVAKADDLLRSGSKSKDAAAAIGSSQHGFYERLRRLCGARVACFTFLVDANGKPLKKIMQEELDAAAMRAAKRTRA